MLVTKLKEIQESKDWTQKELAKCLGLSRSVVAITLSRNRAPSIMFYAACLKNIPETREVVLSCLISRAE